MTNVSFNRCINKMRNLVLSKRTLLQVGKLLKAKQVYFILTILIISFITLFGFSVAQVTSLLQTNKTVYSSGQIKTIGIGIYWDENATNRVSSFDWGIVEPDSKKNIIVYIHNEGNSPITLSMNISNWNPSKAMSYMTLNWNYTGQQIDYSKSIRVELSLLVNKSIKEITNFSFDLTLTGIS